VTAPALVQPEPSRVALLRSIGVLILALVSLLVPKLSLLAALLTFLNFVAIPATAGARKHCLRLTAIAGALALLATFRFLITEAMPGLVRGGLNAAELRAVSRLREIAFAEEALRRHAQFDPDRDGIGSAALLPELSGLTPVRGTTRLDLLNEQYHTLQKTAQGPAALIAGYLFLVCLPTRDGAFSARPDADFDDEASERRFVAYAWPADDAQGVSKVYFIDHQDRILQLDNREGASLRYAGPNFPPPCNAALLPETRRLWTPWRGKKPRAEAPGEPAH
jgi:hypothetical protein